MRAGTPAGSHEPAGFVCVERENIINPALGRRAANVL